MTVDDWMVGDGIKIPANSYKIEVKPNGDVINYDDAGSLPEKIVTINKIIYIRFFIISLRLEIECNPYPNGKNIHLKIHHAGFSGSDSHLVMDLSHFAIGNPHDPDIEFDSHVVRGEGYQAGRDPQRKMLSGFVRSPHGGSFGEFGLGAPHGQLHFVEQRETFAISKRDILSPNERSLIGMFDGIEGIDFQIDTRILVPELDTPVVNRLKSPRIHEPGPDNHIVPECISQKGRYVDGIAFGFDALNHHESIMVVGMG